MRIGDTRELTIEKIVSKGEALARDGSDVWFVPRALEKERVVVRLVSQKKNIFRGELVEVLQASEFRKTPFCPYYEVCGGCDMQHIDHTRQVKVKEEIVLENLRRIGKIETDEQTRTFEYLGAHVDKIEHHRKKVRFQVDPVGLKIGFLSKKSHSVVDLGSCPILSSSLQSLLQDKRELLLSQALRETDRFGKDFVTVAAVEGDDNLISLGEQIVPVTCGEKILYVNSSVFFQAHQGILSHMVSRVRQWAEGETIIDLYSGIGTFASAVESEKRTVYAIEKDPACLALGKKNLKYSTFFTEDAQRWVKRFPSQKVGTVIVDPPRGGLTVQVIESIGKIAPQRLIYISCDSATFARDARLFTERGYSLASLEYLEMYPHTSHTETMALFETQRPRQYRKN